MNRVIVVGGGPAGMMAAVCAAEAGAEVSLYEKNEKLGKKLYLTGKGRCNLTNDCDTDAFLSAVVRNRRFLYSAFAHFTNRDLMRFFEEAGLPLKVERGGRVFPASDRSSDVIRTLERILSAKNVKICLNESVRSIMIEQGICAGVKTGGGPRSADAVILCTGGLAYPQTGSTGDGYALAKDAGGHLVIETKPSLVPYLTGDGWTGELAGLSLKNVRLEARRGKKTLFSEMGEMLFTHTGISGPLTLSMSAYLTDVETENVRCHIDLKPALEEKTLDERILREIDAAPRKHFAHVLNTLLPRLLVLVMARLCETDPDMPSHGVTRAQRQSLARMLKAMPVTLLGPAGYDEAIITRGGIDVKDIDPGTMRSKKLPGLYFAGELMDLDALTGGFNLQIAFSTGAQAGRSAAAQQAYTREER
ncbi:MAG: NAD(P)/FAD-dependent oxidoreductase [Christensenellales bacterium]|jgi:predicted Rossmann fold flavoprotein